MIKRIFLTALCGFSLYGTKAPAPLFKYSEDVQPVVIIGAGPAGLTAALYTSRGGFPTTVYTGFSSGQLSGTSGVENYPGVKNVEGQGLTDIMRSQAITFGADIIEDTVVSVDLSAWPFKFRTENGLEKRAWSIIVATGAHPKKLGVPGEETYWGSGVSSCAKCDGYFFRKQDVFVVGGGDSAVEEAMQLSRHAATVTILVRSERMRAKYLMEEKLREFSNIKVRFNKQVTQVLGDGDKVTGLELYDVLTHKKSVEKADGLFLAIGHNPHTDLFDGQLELNERGYIVLKENCRATSVPGIFAAGDVHDEKYRQANTAAAYGCEAAIDLDIWLRNIGLTDKELKPYRERAQAQTK